VPSFHAVCGPDESVNCGPDLGHNNFAIWVPTAVPTDYPDKNKSAEIKLWQTVNNKIISIHIMPTLLSKCETYRGLALR